MRAIVRAIASSVAWISYTYHHHRTPTKMHLSTYRLSVCPTPFFMDIFTPCRLSYSSLSYTRVREYDETRATTADARVDTMPTRT